ncbi:MAG: glycosyltransferase [Syntrophothermus sp.]
MGLNISFFGSSLVSAYWNGAATYYRGIIKALYNKGHHITFYEPDIYERQQNRDIDNPYYANVVVYQPNQDELDIHLDQARKSDVIIKASGVGIFDELIEKEIVSIKRSEQIIIFWDVDAPATLDRVIHNPKDYFASLISRYDMILTYGGGNPVSKTYLTLGAKECYPIYNALDPDTHFPVPPQEKYKAILSFLGNRLPDREKRVEHFLFETADAMPNEKFILGGSGWGDKWMPENITYLGHVFTGDHNAFNVSPLALLNISRDSMAKYGFSPATRVFEAAGAGACVITDYWKGVDQFFEPEKEILIAKDKNDIVNILKHLTIEKSKEIGSNALKRVLSEHTYIHRAELLENILFRKIDKGLFVK